jgi:hypothetical protein
LFSGGEIVSQIEEFDFDTRRLSHIHQVQKTKQFVDRERKSRSVKSSANLMDREAPRLSMFDDILAETDHLARDV